MIKLKNLFAGIVKKEDLKPAMNVLKEAGVREQDFILMDKDSADIEIKRSGSQLNPVGSMVRAAQRFYGGGPLGFFRDIEKMKNTSKVVIVNSRSLPKKVFEECEKIYQSNPMFEKSKYFGRFATEHYKEGTYMY